MKRYNVTHLTKYTYGEPVELGLHTARLSPIDGARQHLLGHTLDVSPAPTWTAAFTDHFGNAMHQIAIEAAHQELTVIQRSTVEIPPPAWTEPPAGPAWESVRDAMTADGFPEYPDTAEFIYPSPMIPRCAPATAYAAEVFTPGALLPAAALELAKRFKADFKYAPGATTITTPVSEIMAARHGVCQDFTHAMIAGLRGLGLPARYVSGYLKTYAPTTGTESDAAPENAPPENILIGSDASHAWVSVWCGPDLGWLEFDPTNALLVSDEHIALAYGRDFSDVTPLRGVIVGGGEHALSVAVKVELVNQAA